MSIDRRLACALALRAFAAAACGGGSKYVAPAVPSGPSVAAQPATGDVRVRCRIRRQSKLLRPATFGRLALDVALPMQDAKGLAAYAASVSSSFAGRSFVPIRFVARGAVDSENTVVPSFSGGCHLVPLWSLAGGFAPRRGRNRLIQTGIGTARGLAPIPGPRRARGRHPRTGQPAHPGSILADAAGASGHQRRRSRVGGVEPGSGPGGHGYNQRPAQRAGR